VEKRKEFFAHISDAAARIKKRENKIIRTTRNLSTRAAKLIDVDGGIFEHLL
jgi:hypothetical protein